MSTAAPLSVGLVGTGYRATNIYKPIFESLRPWLTLTAVCDPVKEHADAYAEDMNVPAFYSLQEMVASDTIEAALVVAPIDLHHAVSCYLSQHGIPHLVETVMTNTLVQAREMVETAEENDVVLRIAENFFRFPFDRIAKAIADTGFIGPIKRVSCYDGHTGYHNNSRWIKFYDAYPEYAQAIYHGMPTEGHIELYHSVPMGDLKNAPRRYHASEQYRAHFYFFPDDRFVVDHAANIKCLLGRLPRPGYTEMNGSRGTIARLATTNWFAEAEVRYCSDQALRRDGIADEIYPIQHTSENGCWATEFVDLPIGRIEYLNSFRPTNTPAMHAARDYYAAVVMTHIVDFVRAVRGEAESEYMPQDALMATMMDVAVRESAMRNGERLALPLDGDLAADEIELDALREKHGVDPLDIEAMLDVSVPPPWQP
jgi:hypothetical protein